jgi:anaerobic selenocysteine-containing dehydrogenase
LAKASDRIAARLSSAGDGVRFLISAHASHEELFLFRRLSEKLSLGPSSICASWRITEKVQPPDTKFKVPSEDAPNAAGTRMFGLATDVASLQADVEAGRVGALYVFDPGPDGSIGETTWIVDARSSGRLPLLIVQGVLLTNLARAADLVLPGASFFEKEASYTNDQGRLQAAVRAIPSPGEAMDDWQILVNLGAALGVRFGYETAAHIRADIEAQNIAGLDGISRLAFTGPVPARHWLQASNPSERWKWDFMFQDLPPVKGEVDLSSLPTPPGIIPLKEVK